MASFGSVMTALLLFLSGITFAYYTFPWFTALLNALDNVSGAAFADWALIKSIGWLGYIAFILIWVVIAPAYAVFGQDQATG